MPQEPSKAIYVCRLSDLQGKVISELRARDGKNARSSYDSVGLPYPTSRSLCTAADLSHLEYKEAITRFTITWILIFFLYHCHKSNTDNCYFLQLASVMCIISIIMIIVMIMIIIIINIIIISHYYNYYYSWTGPEVSPEEEGRKWG